MAGTARLVKATKQAVGAGLGLRVQLSGDRPTVGVRRSSASSRVLSFEA